jgi:hypothetical protein
MVPDETPKKKSRDPRSWFAFIAMLTSVMRLLLDWSHH